MNWFKEWKIKRCKEKIEYYRGQVDALQALIESSKHTSFERDKFVLGSARLRKYKQRLNNLCYDEKEKYGNGTDSKKIG